MNSKEKDEELGRLLRKFRLKVAPIKLQLTSPDGATEEFAVRLFTPGEGFLDALGSPDWIKRGNLDAHLLALRLFRLANVSSLKQRRHDRRLDLEVFKCSSVYRELRKTTRLADKPMELIQETVGYMNESIEELLREARYQNRSAGVPVDRQSYHEFREMLLLEVETLDEECLKKASELAGSQAAGERVMDIHGEDILRMVILKALKLDENPARIMRPIADRAQAISIKAGQDHKGDPGRAVEEFLDWAAIDDLLRDTAHVLEEEAGKSRENLRVADEMRRAAAGRSTEGKLDHLRYIWENYGDRSMLVEQVFRDVDHAGPYLLGQIAWPILKALRPYLIPAERRLFALMYFQRLPRFGAPVTFPLGGWSLMFDPITQGLMFDEESAGLAVLVLGFRRKELWGENLAESFYRRFQAYLRFYGYWLELQRQHDREGRSRRRERAKGTVELSDVDLRVTENKHAKTPFEMMVARAGELFQLLDQYGIRDRKGIARMRWIEGLNQAEIGARLDVSQQAVSKALRKMVNELVEKLPGVQGDASGVKWPKGKWGPRE